MTNSYLYISKITGKLTLIACPRNCVNKEFYYVLKEHFSICLSS